MKPARFALVAVALETVIAFGPYERWRGRNPRAAFSRGLMRSRIIGVNVLIVLIVGLLSFALVRSSLEKMTSRGDEVRRAARHEAEAIASSLLVSAARVERVLETKVDDSEFRSAIEAAKGAGDVATSKATSLKNQAKGWGITFAKVAVVDADGKLIGRDSSSLERGNDVFAKLPALRDTLKDGIARSDVWADGQTQLLASFAPVRDESGKVVGAIIGGVPMSDVLGRAASGSRVVLSAREASGWHAVGQVGIGAGEEGLVTAKSDLLAKTAQEAAPQFAEEGKSLIVTAPLADFGDGKSVVVAALAATSLLPNAVEAASPILAVMGLGLLLVIAGGLWLGMFLDTPIEVIEHGLLEIANGNTDMRFDIDHPDLGGVANNLNTLLNKFMNVEEDNTDDQGRPLRG
jgi:hypothetical protein